MNKVAWALVAVLSVALAVTVTMLVTRDDTAGLTVKRAYVCSREDMAAAGNKCDDGVAAIARRVCQSRAVAAVDVTVFMPTGPSFTTTAVCADYR